MDLNVVHAFVESINASDVGNIYNLMTHDHEFIDSRGNKMTGRDNMKKAWISYFALFPDYTIEITDTLQNDSIIVMLGYASGTYKINNEISNISKHWRIPASWKAIVENQKIKLWQVYADNSVILDFIYSSANH